MANTEKMKLEVYPRVRIGKSGAYRARLDGLIPAVIYGSAIHGNKEGIPINLDDRNFRKIYATAGKSTVIDVDAREGTDKDIVGSKVLIKALQSHPYKNKVLHVDLQQLDLKKPIRVTVPLNFTGTPVGEEDGGIFSVLNRNVEIRCLPADIPHDITVDVSHLALDESMKVSQVQEQRKDKPWEFIFENDVSVCAVLRPEEEVSSTPASAAVGAEAAASAEAEEKKE